MTVTKREFAGLNTEATPDKIPEGATEIAQNVVCRKAGILEPRPGLYQSVQISSLSDCQAVYNFGGDLVMQDDAKTWSEPAGDDLNNPDAGEVQGYDGYCSAAQSRGNLYFASQLNPQKLIDYQDDTTRWTGLVPWCEVLIGSTTAGVTSAEEFLANNEGVGYRVTVKQEDANGVVTRSAPSTVYFVENSSGGAKRVLLSIYLNSTPNAYPGGSASQTIEVYRTTTTTAGAPSDKYYLVIEHTPTAAEFTAGVVTLYDVKSDAELGRECYSNPGIEGREYSAPRKAKVAAEFARSMFYANLRDPQNKLMEFRGTAPNQVAGTLTATVTSGNTNITWSAFTANYTGADFVVGLMLYHATYFPNGSIVTAVGAGTATVSIAPSASGAGVSISCVDTISITDGTTTELYRSHYIVYDVMTNVGSIYTPITTGPSALVTARWINTYNSDAGPTDYSFVLEALPGTSETVTLSVKATNAAVRYNGGAISEYGDGFTAPGAFEQEEYPALVEWSADGLPESFIRGINQAFVGDLKSTIYAMFASGNRLYIFKEDGIYVLDGQSETAGFRLDTLSRKWRLMSPRHVAQAPGGLFAWTIDGVIMIDEAGGIRNISEQAIASLLATFVQSETLVGAMVFADRNLHISADQTLADEERSFHYVWNIETQQWTEWDLLFTAACAPGNTLYGQPAKVAFVQDQGSAIYYWQIPTIVTVSGNETPPEYLYADFRTGTTTVTATPSSSGTTYFYQFTADFSSFGVAPQVGDMLISIAQYWKGVITDVANAVGGDLTITFYSRDTVAASSTTIQLLYGYDVDVRLRELSAQDPLKFAHWLGAYWDFEGPMSLYKVTCGARSSLYDNHSVVQRARNYPILDQPVPAQPGFAPRYLFTPTHGRARRIKPYVQIREAGAQWKLQAMTLEGREVSRKVHRN